MRGLPSSTLAWSTHPSNHTAHHAKSITSILHSTTWWPYLGMMTISSKGISKQWYRTHYICISSTLTEKCTSISGSATWQVNWRKPYKSSFAAVIMPACLPHTQQSTLQLEFALWQFSYKLSWSIPLLYSMSQPVCELHWLNTGSITSLWSPHKLHYTILYFVLSTRHHMTIGPSILVSSLFAKKKGANILY